MTAEVSQLLRAMSLQPISIQPIYRIVTGSYSSAVVLSQTMYWHAKMGRKFYKTDEDFSSELYMSLKEFRNAKAKIKILPFVTIKAEGIPAKTFYDVNYDIFFSSMKMVISSLPQTVDSSLPQMVQTGLDQTVQTITETTTETTTDISTLPAEAVRLTDTLIAHVKTINSNPKNLSAGKFDGTRYSWASDIDKANRIDGRSWTMLSEVLCYAINDEFWRCNILSGKKLRIQYDILEARMVKDKPKPRAI